MACTALQGSRVSMLTDGAVRLRTLSTVVFSPTAAPGPLSRGRPVFGPPTKAGGKVRVGLRARVFAVSVLVAGSFAAAGTASAATFFVSPSGNDANGCSQSLPCREIRRALQLVAAGDTIQVADGSY